MAHYVIFIEFIKVTWRKNVTLYVKMERLWQKRNFIRNVLQPTRSLCHFRFKSYGPLSDFHKSGDLDLALHPIFKKKKFIVLGLEDIFCQKIRTIGQAVRPVHRERTDRQTDRQTNRQTDRGDQYTLRKSKIFHKVKIALPQNLRSAITSAHNNNRERGRRMRIAKEWEKRYQWYHTHFECDIVDIVFSTQYDLYQWAISVTSIWYYIISFINKSPLDPRSTKW